MAQGEQKPENGGAFSDSLQERLAHWQDALTKAAGTDELKHVANRAINACDELWEHNDILCTFGGNGVFPIVDEENGVTVSAGYTSGEGYSRGFSVYDFLNNDNPRLYHMFFLGHVESVPHPVATNATSLFAYLDVNSVIIPNNELESALVPRPPEAADRELDIADMMQGIDSQSLRLVRLLSSRQFQKQGAEQQRSILDRFVMRCEQKYDLRDMGVMIEDTPYCCRPELTEDGGIIYEYISVSENILQGTLLGLGSLERARLNNRPIRRSRDLVNRAAGLCLVVSVEEVNEPSGLSPHDIVYIPTADQDISVTYFMQGKALDMSAWIRTMESDDGGPGEMVG